MKFKKCLILFILIPFFSLSQDLSGYNTAFDYIESNLKKDVFYYMDFEKDSIPPPIIYSSRESMNFNLKPFVHNNDLISIVNRDGLCDDISCLEDRLNKNAECNKNAIIPRLGKNKNVSNYIVFFTTIEEDVLMAEVLFLRDEYFNVPGKTEYETWMRFNSGVTYLFLFSDGGCMNKVASKGISYH